MIGKLVHLCVMLNKYKYQQKKSLCHIARANGYQQLQRSIEGRLIINNGRARGLTAMQIMEGKQFVQQG
jgi:hypothetical protein